LVNRIHNLVILSFSISKLELEYPFDPASLYHIGSNTSGLNKHLLGSNIFVSLSILKASVFYPWAVRKGPLPSFYQNSEVLSMDLKFRHILKCSSLQHSDTTTRGSGILLS